jgi:PleD family two-component response regulator
MIVKPSGMNSHSLQLQTGIATAGTVVVVDEDAQRRRRIEFIISMAGYEVLGMQDDQEAANWLLSQPVTQAAALILMPLLNSAHVGTLAKIIPARVSVPVIFVADSGTSDTGKYVDVVFDGGNCCVRTTETYLLEALQNIFKLKPAAREQSTNSKTRACGHATEMTLSPGENQ